MSQRAELAAGGWLRLLAVLAATGGWCAFLTDNATSDEALAILPWFAGVLVCYVAPIFVSRQTSLYSPPGLVGLQGALATFAIMAYVAHHGRASFAPLGFLPEGERIDLAQKAAVLLIVAQCSYLFGYYRSTGKLFSPLFPAVGGRQWNGSKLIVAIALTALVVVPVYYLFQKEVGGSALDITQLGRGKAVIRADVQRSWMVRGIMLAYVPTMLLACAAMIDRSKILLAVTGGAFLLVAILVTRMGQRGPAVMVGFILLMLFHFHWRRVRLYVVVLTLLGTLAAVNVLGDLRAGGRAGAGIVERMVNPNDILVAHERDRNRLNVLGVVLHYFPERQPFLLGRTYTALPTALIPRWLWPEKVKLFKWRSNRIVRQLVGLPAPPPVSGVLYANFSWIGVVLGMALFGVFHRGLYRYHQKSPGDVGVTLLYATTAVVFLPTLHGFSVTIQFVLPLTAIIYAVSRRGKKQINASRRLV